MAAHDSTLWSRREAVKLARAMLSGELGLLEGSIPLASLAHAIVPDWTKDPDFLVFANISDEIDHLPFGSARDNWNQASLARADADIERITRQVRDEVVVACQHIIGRFDDPTLGALENRGAV
jgi:hypothetical protein